MLKTATTDATTVNRLQVGKLRHGKQSLLYKRQEPENLHTRVYKELGPELSHIDVYF